MENPSHCLTSNPEEGSCLCCCAVAARFFLTSCLFAGLFAVVSGADWVSAGVQPAAGAAAWQRDGSQACGWRGGPVLHANRRAGHQHLRWSPACPNPSVGRTLLLEDGQAKKGGPDYCLPSSLPRLPGAQLLQRMSLTCPPRLPRQGGAPFLPCSAPPTTFLASVPSNPGHRPEH